MVVKASGMNREVGDRLKLKLTKMFSAYALSCVKIERSMLTVRMLTDEVSLKRETVRKILTDDLSMKKLCAKMVTKNLSAEQKHERMSISQDCLEQVEPDPTLLV